METKSWKGIEAWVVMEGDIADLSGEPEKYVIQTAYIDQEDNCIRILCGDARFIIMQEQECCESRWFSTEDDLSVLENKTLKSVSVSGFRSSGGKNELYTESAFLNIKTTDGTLVTVDSYNEHNGYYTGISAYMTLAVLTGDEEDGGAFITDQQFFDAAWNYHVVDGGAPGYDSYDGVCTYEAGDCVGCQDMPYKVRRALYDLGQPVHVAVAQEPVIRAFFRESNLDFIKAMQLAHDKPATLYEDEEEFRRQVAINYRRVAKEFGLVVPE